MWPEVSLISLNWSRSMYSNAPGRRAGGHGDQRALDAALELAAVVQLGQGVVGGLVAQHLGELALLGDVGGDHQQLRVVVERRPARPTRWPRSARRRRRTAPPRHCCNRGCRDPATASRNSVSANSAGSSSWYTRLAEALARGLVGVGDAPVLAVGEQHQRRQAVVQRAEPLLAFAVSGGSCASPAPAHDAGWSPPTTPATPSAGSPAGRATASSRAIGSRPAPARRGWITTRQTRPP